MAVAGEQFAGECQNHPVIVDNENFFGLGHGAFKIGGSRVLEAFCSKLQGSFDRMEYRLFKVRSLPPTLAAGKALGLRFNISKKDRK
jgi:hypothetical protein